MRAEKHIEAEEITREKGSREIRNRDRANEDRREGALKRLGGRILKRRSTGSRRPTRPRSPNQKKSMGRKFHSSEQEKSSNTQGGDEHSDYQATTSKLSTYGEQNRIVV